MSKLSNYWRELALALLIAVIVSSLQLVTLPVADDWGPLTAAAAAAHGGRLWRASFQPRDVHWSPLWFLMNGAVYKLSPQSFGIVPLAVVKCLALTLLIATLLVLLRALQVRPAIALAAACFLVFHQAGVGALYQWKGGGAICSCAFGSAAVALVVIDTIRHRTSAARSAATAVLLLVALLFKETALCHGAMMAMLLIGSLFAPIVFGSMRESARRIVPSLIACAAFLIARTIVGTTLQLSMSQGGFHRYRLGNPLEWLVNGAQLLGAVATPVSTLQWFDAMRGGHWASIALYAAVTLAFGIFIVFGLVRVRQEFRAPIVLATIGLLSSWFPIGVMHHISETYIEPALFWYSVLLAIALQALLGKARTATVAVFALVFVVHLAGFADKLFEMIETGEHETSAMERSIPRLRSIPAGSLVFISNADAPRLTSYSVYREFDPASAVQFGIVHYGIPLRIDGNYERDAAYRIEVGETARVLKTR